MIARVIENWLTSANERGYEVPFCQLLMAEGYNIVHLNRHSPLEQGKDIIAIDSNGELCGFQLKGGNISLSRWRREVKPEVDELIEAIVEHPAVEPIHARPILVTNGRIQEEVINLVSTLNRGNNRRGYKPLELIDGRALAGRFVKCHGHFLPHEPADFESFLRLFLADGRDFLPKSRFARFIESQLDPKIAREPRQYQRAIASTVLLAAYALSAYERCKNHFAVFEGWVMVVAAISRLAERRRIAKKLWRASFDLTLGAARFAMSLLVEEAIGRRNLVEGDPMMDGGPPYRARATIVLGVAAGRVLMGNGKSDESELRAQMSALFEKYSKHLLLWGESAIPYFVAMALWLESCGRSREAEEMAHSLLDNIVNSNSRRSRQGIPNPYYGVTQCVGLLCSIGEDFTKGDSPQGHSYCCESLMEFLVRRLRFQALRYSWKEISEIQLCEMEYENRTDFYAWHTDRGVLRQRFVSRPESRKKLEAKANESIAKKLPKMIIENSSFALMFMFVFPHRFGPALLRRIDLTQE